ncbi:hypothetical protein [Streptomyces mirabilis]|uniref:hypothetical protein n=1 Tax=Streptomyces mirabilis TaxID=68239 RepID=UPI00368DBA24
MRSNEPDEPVDPATFPPELQNALRIMSARGDGPVVDLSTGAVVAQDGHLVGELVACHECARAVALGWLGAIARHPAPHGAEVCTLCCEGEATLTPAQWFTMTAQLLGENARRGMWRSWRDDAVRGLGAITMPEPPGQD